MKFKRTQVRDKKLGIIEVYTPEDIPSQLRHMHAAAYQRVILGNAEGFKFLRDIFLIAMKIKKHKAIFYIPDHSTHGERYEDWFKVGQFHMNLVVINYHSFVGKPKLVKEIIDKSKKITGEIIALEAEKGLIEDIPCWQLENAYHVKTHGKHIICSSNELGLMDLASLANRFVGLADVETSMCDYHIHLGHYKTEDRVATDFWYYYQSDDKQ